MGKCPKPFIALLVALSSTLTACGEAEKPACADPDSGGKNGTSGTGRVFKVDPKTDSGYRDLAVSSARLDDFRTTVRLERLSGEGVLKGRFADVHTASCREKYSAYSNEHIFDYSQYDGRFQEVMAYHHADRYRSRIKQSTGVGGRDQIVLIAHCPVVENAYYSRSFLGSDLVEEICLGTSHSSHGASYANDAHVIVHELQHSHTAHAYSFQRPLGTLGYDEGGAVNEGVSDFLALAHLEDQVPTPVDPRYFSPWSLGSFVPGESSMRGVHRCPAYDSDFKNNCAGSRTGADAFSLSSSRITYNYPDGIGWPYFPLGVSSLSDVIAKSRRSDEIHNSAIIVSGALWDAQRALARVNGVNPPQVFDRMARLVIEALKILPKPEEQTPRLSPVTIPGFARKIIEVSSAVGFSPHEVSAISEAFEGRGVLNLPVLEQDWASIAGSGRGAFVLKDLNRLKQIRPEVAAIGSHQDVAAIWFNIVNQDALTAAGVNVNVTIETPGVEFLEPRFNPGWISPQQAMVQYSKINGSSIVQALAIPSPVLAGASLEIGSENSAELSSSYFGSNPSFATHPRTALFVRFNRVAQVTFKIELTASNAPSQILSFNVENR